MALFDCILYNGEDLLLEIRLNELSEVVDKFLICESNHTFSGKPKPYKFDATKFPKFLDRMVYLPHKAVPYKNAWENEKDQREFFLDYLARNAQVNDFVLLGDVDEIPNVLALQYAMANFMQPVAFQMRFFYYFLNYKRHEWWYGTVLAKFKQITSMEALRRKRTKLDFLEDAGWHFSFLGTIENIIEKIESFSHQEYNTEQYKDKKHLEKVIAEKKDLFNRDIGIEKVPIDVSYPKYILHHFYKFKNYLGE